MELIAEVYVSWGRWLAECPRPGCSNAEHYGPDPITGYVGGLTARGFNCAPPPHGCGLTCAAQWPPNIDAIEQILQLRPALQMRNWRAPETVHDLLAENIEHGDVPMGDEGKLLEILDGDIIVGRRSLSGPLREVGA